jgi:hypothetical protein
MTEIEMTRRAILLLAASLAVSPITWARPRPDGPAGQQREALLRMARQLYPHPALADDVYTDVLESLYASAANDPVLADSLHSSLEILDAAVGGDWLAADAESQVKALKSIEKGDFFATIQNLVRLALYSHPTVWELIGYEGSAVEFGGYIDRGFDDIDWLPAD